MENNSKKVSLVLIILIVILLIGVGICSYILISKNKEIKSNNTNISTNVAQTSKNEQTQNNTENTTTQLSADERFKSYAENIVKGLNSYKDAEKNPSGDTYSPTSYIQIRGDYLKQAKVEKAEIKYNGDLYIIKNGTETLVRSNVLSCYELEIGNGGYTSIMFINTDGTVSYLDTQSFIDSGKITVKNYTSAKNITNLINISFATAATVYGIDIDGNLVELQ